MAKGTAAKQEVTAKLLEVFDGAFVYNGGKEIRIPMTEDGAAIQIKITLTCAKDNVEPGDEDAIPGAATASKATSIGTAAIPSGDFSFGEKKIVEPSEAELNAVNDLMNALNL